MSEPHAEPPAADVRSFLPRPGEPVEDYAARLRALHHDLTLVLDAVERGLAAADRSPELVEAHEIAAVAEPYMPEEPHRPPPPPGPLVSSRGSAARVEVVSAPPSAPSEETGGERSWSGPPEPTGSTSQAGRGVPGGEGAPAGGGPAAPSPERSPFEGTERAPLDTPERSPFGGPWVEPPPPAPRTSPWQEPPSWQEPQVWREERRTSWPAPPAVPAELAYEPPPHAPFAAPPRRRPSVPPVVVAALLLGWLVAIALLIVVIFD